MNKRVREGLGLVVVAIIAFLIMLVLQAPAAEGGVVIQFFWATAALVAMLVGFVGLVLLAWGLLRPPSETKG